MSASQGGARGFGQGPKATTQDPVAAVGADIVWGSGDWSPIKRSGFHRLMSILADIDLGEISNKTAATFATGSYGHERMFPRLRDARHCFQFTLSGAAVDPGASATAENVVALLTDGETIPLDDDVVEIFWAGEILEAVRQPRLLLQEIVRVCKQDAKVLLSASNRDALYYAAAGEQYDVSAGHIALMSYGDLYRSASLFLSDVAIAGYETSLNPALDTQFSSAELLRLVQERAALYPPSASGLLAEGRASKALYERNHRRWVLTEYVWDSKALSVTRPLEPMPIYGSVDAGGLGPGERIECEVEARELALLFWSHPWSGYVRVTLDGKVETTDLYSSHTGFKRMDFTDLTSESHTLSIERVADKRATALGSEVIFAKLIASS